MTARSRGRDLFIVDNSVSGWTGLRYLKEWAGIASRVGHEPDDRPDGPDLGSNRPDQNCREQRAMEIASAYAERLGVSSQAIARLTAGYLSDRPRRRHDSAQP